MPDRREVLALLGVGAIAGVIGWTISSRRFTPQGDDAREFSLARFADLDGKPRSLSEWEGRVRVVNFWATWCPPCREEIPALVASREKLLASGVEFIGIAIDQASKVSEFARSVRISYPVFIADPGVFEWVRKLGNPSGGLPFTVVLNQKGAVTHRNLGVVTRQKIEDQVQATLAG